MDLAMTAQTAALYPIRISVQFICLRNNRDNFSLIEMGGIMEALPPTSQVHRSRLTMRGEQLRIVLQGEPWSYIEEQTRESEGLHSLSSNRH